MPQYSGAANELANKYNSPACSDMLNTEAIRVGFGVDGASTRTGCLLTLHSYRFHAIEKRQDTRAAQFIKYLQSLFFIPNDSHISQLGQMSGYGRHVRSHQLRQFIDTMLAMGKGLQDTKPGRMGQCLEYFRMLFKSLITFTFRRRHN